MQRSVLPPLQGLRIAPIYPGFQRRISEAQCCGSLEERLVLKPPVDGARPPLDPAQERREENARILEEAEQQVEAAVEEGQGAAATENAYQAFNSRKKIQEAELRARRQKDQEVAQRPRNRSGAGQEGPRRKENKLASRLQSFRKKVVGNKRTDAIIGKEETKERK